MTRDRPLFGILLMIGFCALAPLGDSIAKLLGTTIPLLQLLLVRFAMQTAILLPAVLARGAFPRLSRPVAWLIVVRTGLHIAGIGAMFTALRYLPLADAVAIAFVMPFLLLLLGRYFLGETVGPFRLAACVVAFIGTLLVIQPSFAAVGLPALLPLAVALIFALFIFVTRKIAKEIDPVGLQVVSGAIATLTLGAIALFDLSDTIPAAGFVRPNSTETLLLVAIGVVGTLAHLLMTWSLRYAPAATLAPIQYLEIPFATVIGWIVFRELPNGLAAVGIAITVGAGLFVVYRERKAARLIPPET